MVKRLLKASCQVSSVESVLDSFKLMGMVTVLVMAIVDER